MLDGKVTKSAIRRALFKNVLVYAVVASLVTVVLLLVLLALPLARKFTTMIVTAEIFMLFVLIYCLVYMHMFIQNVLSKLEKKDSYKLKVDRCPDFYTSHRDINGNVICTNGVDYPDSGHAFVYVNAEGRAVPDEVPLKTVDGKKHKEACLVANPKTKESPNYNIPWTAVRPRCMTGASDGPEPEDNKTSNSCDTHLGFVF